MSDGEITALAILLAGLLVAEGEGKGQSQNQKRRREHAESEPARAECAGTA